MLDSQSKNIMRYTLFLRHNSAKTMKGEDVQVSTEKYNFLFHGQGAVHGRDNQKSICLQKYLIYLAILFLKTNETF